MTLCHKINLKTHRINSNIKYSTATSGVSPGKKQGLPKVLALFKFTAIHQSFQNLSQFENLSKINIFEDKEACKLTVILVSDFKISDQIYVDLRVEQLIRFSCLVDS